MLNKKINYQKGFTLIEMVIVIAVMGVLMGIAFRGFSSIQQNARDTRRVANLRTVATQLELYFARCGHYPTTADCRASQPTSPLGTNLVWGVGNTPVATTLRGRLSVGTGAVASAADVPVDPILARPVADQYRYFFGANGLSYVIGALPERAGNNNPDVTGMVLGLDCDRFYCVSN